MSLLLVARRGSARDTLQCRRAGASTPSKYALALRRISLACRSSRFSRSRAFSFVAISVGTPARAPLSRSAFFTHSCSVCAVQPILAAIDEHRRPARGMLAFVIQNHPHRAGAHLGRELVGRLACHGSTFSGVGASDKPGAVQALLRARAVRTIDALWRAIGEICDLFSPQGYQNYFHAAGYAIRLESPTLYPARSAIIDEGGQPHEISLGPREFRPRRLSIASRGLHGTRRPLRSFKVDP